MNSIRGQKARPVRGRQTAAQTREKSGQGKGGKRQRFAAIFDRASTESPEAHLQHERVVVAGVERLLLAGATEARGAALEPAVPAAAGLQA